MKIISICIGSACHIKGSYEVMEALKSLIKEYGLENQVEIQATFCLKNCAHGVSVKRWDNKILSVSKDNVRQVFENELLDYL